MALLVIFCVAVAFGSVASAAWREPSSPPPADNIAAPLSQDTLFGLQPVNNNNTNPSSDIIGLYGRLKINLPCGDGQILQWKVQGSSGSEWGQVVCVDPSAGVSLLSVLNNNPDASAYDGATKGLIVMGLTEDTHLHVGGEVQASWIHAISTTGFSSIAGKLGIGVNPNDPNSMLHIYNTDANAEIDIQSRPGSGSHWGIYHDYDSNDLKFWQGDDRVKFSDDGIVTASDFCIGGTGGKCLSGNAAISFAGLVTVKVNGSQGGYTGMNDKCDSQFSGSHICSSNEMLILAKTPAVFIGTGDYAWIATGVAGFKDDYLVNDCIGWTTSADNGYGSIWRFDGASVAGGSVWLSQCNAMRQIACCR